MTEFFRSDTEALRERRDALTQRLLKEGSSASTHLHLSEVEMRLGFTRGSANHAHLAAQQRPDSIDTIAGILRQLRIANLGREFLAYADHIGPPARMPIPMLLRVARECSLFNLQERARTYVNEALVADPQYPATLLAHAQLSIYEGNPVEAGRVLRKVAQRAPEIPETYWLLAQLGRRNRGDVDDVSAALLQLQRPDQSSNGRIFLEYALHRFLDEQGAHEAAFAHLAAGMAAKRESLQYDKTQTDGVFGRLRLLPRLDHRTHVADECPRPIFIVGMHRSGTTLLEQLLAAHPRVRGLGELYDFTSAMRHATDHHCEGAIDATLVQKALQVPPDYAAVGRRYLDGVQWRLDGARIFTDKLPSNFLNIGFIVRAIPNARIIHMVRDPMDTCFSNLRELYSEANPWSYDQLELADYYAKYRGLMDHWKLKYSDRILDVDYAQLVTDTEGSMRAIAEFCGLDFDPAMLDPRHARRVVATASAVQVRENVTKPSSGKWENYSEQLAPLRNRIKRLGINAR